MAAAARAASRCTPHHRDQARRPFVIKILWNDLGSKFVGVFHNKHVAVGSPAKVLVRNSKRVREYYNEYQISDLKTCFKKHAKVANVVSVPPVVRRASKRKSNHDLPRRKPVRIASDNSWRGEHCVSKVVGSLPPTLKHRFNSLTSGRPPDE